jgi:hypothetical protein
MWAWWRTVVVIAAHIGSHHSSAAVVCFPRLPVQTTVIRVATSWTVLNLVALTVVFILTVLRLYCAAGSTIENQVPGTTRPREKKVRLKATLIKVVRWFLRTAADDKSV